MLIEADRIISETLPYFQTSLNTNKVKNSNGFRSLKANTEVIPAQPKRLRNDTKRVDFNITNDFKNVKIYQKQSKTSAIHGLYLKIFSKYNYMYNFLFLNLLFHFWCTIFICYYTPIKVIKYVLICVSNHKCLKQLSMGIKLNYGIT